MVADLEQRTADMFVTSAILEEGRLSEGALGIQEIVDFLTRNSASLTPAQTRRLFADRTLRETYRQLKSELAAMQMPRIAAASSGDVVERRFDGGTLRLTPSRNGLHVNLLIRFDDPGRTGGPLMLILETAQDIAKLAVPPPDAAGEVFLILDRSSDAAFIAAIGDPQATGSFVTAGE
jgi:hypothetical protein